MRAKRTVLKILLIGAIVILATLVLVYMFGRSYYAKHFYQGTYINGIHMGNLTEQEAVEKLGRFVRDYLVEVETYQGEKENLLGPDFDYAYADNGEIGELLTLTQNESRWVADFKKEFYYQVSEPVTLDDLKLKTAFLALAMCDTDRMTSPVDAHIEKNPETDAYELIPETDGNVLHLDDAFEAVKKAVHSGAETILLDASYFDRAKITSDDDELVACMANITAYFGTSIVYDLGDDSEELDAATIQTWLTVDDAFNVAVDEYKVESYVQYLASKYNTYGDERAFRTSAGDVITIGGGDYGWVVDKPAEKAQILEDLKRGGRIEREMVYEQRAKVLGLDDIGDTYVEIDYTNQHLYYYVQGELVLDTDVVTGNLNRGNGSPDGLFKIVYKERDAILVGEGYSSPVSYFMPFAYNVGIHDATWRSSFGGEIYLSNGSHGCINVPFAVAEELFGILEVGTPVIAYYREPVVLTADNAGYSNAYSYISPEKLKEMQEAEAAAQAAAQNAQQETAPEEPDVVDETADAPDDAATTDEPGEVIDLSM